MSDTSSLSTPQTKRRSWLQFGTRTLLALILLGAFAAWWARDEMLKEQQREELIVAAKDNRYSVIYLAPTTKAPWNRRLGAWLRGQPPTPNVDGGSFNEPLRPSLTGQFVEAFPEAQLDVYINGPYATPDVLKSLARAKLLESLDFAFEPFDTSDKSLSLLGKIRVKYSLSFAVERVDDELLRRVAAARIDPSSIWDLSCDDAYGWSTVTNEGLRTAARFRKLSRLYASRAGSDAGVAAFRDHPKVHTVELIGPGYTDASAEVITTLRQLQSLSFVGTKLTDAGMAKAIQDRRLSSLKFDNVALGESSIAAIASVPSLEHLELNHVRLTPELMAAIAKQPLVSLMLRGDYTDAELREFAPVAPKLMTIELHTPNVTDQGLAWLADAKQILNVHLNDTKATAATMKVIATTHPCVNIHLGGPNIDATVLAEAGRTFKLGMIWLIGPSIDDEVLAALGPHESLSLAGTRTTAAGLLALKTADKKSRVEIFYPKDNKPPFTPTEVEELRASVDLELLPVMPAIYDRMLPGSSRRTTSEAASP